MADNGSFAGRLAQQAQTATNKGVVPGAKVNQSLAYTLSQKLGWVGQ